MLLKGRWKQVVKLSQQQAAETQLPKVTLIWQRWWRALLQDPCGTNTTGSSFYFPFCRLRRFFFLSRDCQGALGDVVDSASSGPVTLTSYMGSAGMPQFPSKIGKTTFSKCFLPADLHRSMSKSKSFTHSGSWHPTCRHQRLGVYAENIPLASAHWAFPCRSCQSHETGFLLPFFASSLIAGTFWCHL